MSHDHAETADCSETLHRIFEYLDGEMTPDETARVALHLANCGPCLAQHDLDLAMKALIKRSCNQETAPDRLRATILSSFTSVRTVSSDGDQVVYREQTQYRIED
ncbi:mycothiol system anti-sigma-R factor [Janibacter sp. GXQ6167]|uniref:mycothiol system anti-sigma-R factor n=1 Tax=Janibacter sp. GXQ6167 TaxID=3240791 RepID=UPI003524EF5E